MTRNQCLINGCLFLDLGDDHDRYVNSDLFEVGDCYVLNCVRRPRGHAAWEVASSPRPGPISALERLESAFAGKLWLAGYVFWERSGVIVIEKKLAIVGEAAAKYMYKWNPDLQLNPRWTEVK